MHLFIIPLLVMVITQGLKFVLDAAKNGINWQTINGYGGMPSSHAALVTSLVYLIWREEGWQSPAFAIAVVFMVLVLRDAMGFRFQIGIHGKILNRLIKELPDEEEYKYPILKEVMGHKISEVAVGIIVGIVFTVLLKPFF